MYSVQLLLRVAKTISVAAIALMSLLVVTGNVTDYYTNYYFVEHVMKMDTIFPESHIHYRNINNSFLFHAGYICIIAVQTLMAFCCMKGSWFLFKNFRSSATIFHAAKNWAVAGITIGIVIWFLGFEVIGGEWFAMWQSSKWNGLGAAERIVSFLVLVLILLHLKEEEIPQ
jgi:predicted small integral membrane protein